MDWMNHLAAEFKDSIKNIKYEDVKNVTLISQEAVMKLAADLKGHAENLKPQDINRLFESAKEHAGNNPTQAALLVIQVLLLICPIVVTAPLFAALGLTAVGPLAGSLAPAMQAKFGSFFLFCLLQSAAMGGYGAPIVAGSIRAASAAGAAFNVAQGLFRNWTQGRTQIEL